MGDLVNDIIVGGNGNDDLYGGGDNDAIVSQAGTDGSGGTDYCDAETELNCEGLSRPKGLCTAGPPTHVRALKYFLAFLPLMAGGPTMPHADVSAKVAHLTDRELLDLYLSLPPTARDEKFVDTAQAAEITGVSIRTIQLWIENGAVRAIVIGRKYRVVLDSLRAHLEIQMSKQLGEHPMSSTKFTNFT